MRPSQLVQLDIRHFACLFVSFAGVIVFSYRFFQVKPRLKEVWLNVSSLVAVYASCFGLTLVGNFQVNSADNRHLPFMAVCEIMSSWVLVFRCTNHTQHQCPGGVCDGNGVLLAADLYHHKDKHEE